MEKPKDDDKILLSHHVQQQLCNTRLPYRRGRKLTAVKVYSIAKESNHLLIFGVPSLNLRQETKLLFIRFGKLLQFNISKDHSAEPLTETYHARYERIQAARLAKRTLDMKNFYGGSLHVCYAPEFETVNETHQKLIQRQKDVLFRLKYLQNEEKRLSKEPQSNNTSINVVEPQNCIKNLLNMGEINIIGTGNDVKMNKRKINSNVIVEKKFKPCFVDNIETVSDVIADNNEKASSNVKRTLTDVPVLKTSLQFKSIAHAFQMPATDVKELKRRRGIYKGRLTSFAAYLNSLNLKELQSVNVMELQLRVAKLEELYNEEFDKVQLELELLEDNPGTEMSERIKIEAHYYPLISQAKDIINNFSKPSSSTTSRFNRVPVKLPTIHLPKFSGLCDNWLEFRDTFTSLVHDNDDIDEINKFHYLRSSLEGSAAVMVQSYEFSAQNYNVAWNLLCERFDNKRLLIQNHVSTIFNLDQITKSVKKNYLNVLISGTTDTISKILSPLECYIIPDYYTLYL